MITNATARQRSSPRSMWPKVQVWDVEGGSQLFNAEVSLEHRGGIAWSPDSLQLLISTGEARHKFLWDVKLRELSDPVGFPGCRTIS